MRIIRNFPPTSSGCGFTSVLTLGTFDGVHKGHRHILSKLTGKAIDLGLQSVVVTFDRHPAFVLTPAEAPRVIMTLDEKLEALEGCGIDIVAVIPFKTETAHMDAETFTKRFLLDCLGMKCFIVGYDHGFGKQRHGSGDSIQTMSKRYGFTLEVETPYTSNGTIVKSSTIREFITEGNVKRATELLGADYSLSGKVVHGRGIGSRRLGFPTANVETIHSEKIVPAGGVYSGWVSHKGRRYTAVINIGTRPTLNVDEPAIEAHIIDFSGVLYDEELRVGFSRRIRETIKFDSEEDLVLQIRKDVQSVRH